MSFMSKLAKGLAIGGAGLGTALSFGAASPVLAGTLGGLGLGGATGGAVAGGLSAAGSALGNLGRTAGAAAQGSADTRERDAQINNQRDSNLIANTNAQIGQRTSNDAQALQRAQLGIDSASQRAKQAATGDALSHVQDVNINFQPRTGALPNFSVSGGLRPSMFGNTARSAGDTLGRQALLALMTKSDVPEASPLVAAPTLSKPTASGGLEKTLGGVGLGASILGGLGDVLKRRAAVTPPSEQNDWYSGWGS